MISKTKYHIRWAVTSDYDEIAHLEYLVYGKEKFTKSEIINIDKKRDNIICAVEDGKERIVAYFIYALTKGKLSITRLVVHPDHNFKVVGDNILAKLKDKLHHDRRTKIEMEIGDDDLPMHLLLKDNGFLAIDVIREMYGDDGDMYIFEYNIP